MAYRGRSRLVCHQRPLFFVRLSYPSRGGAVPPFRSVVRALGSPVSILLGLVLMLYVGVEIAFGDFGAAFMERVQDVRERLRRLQ